MAQFHQPYPWDYRNARLMIVDVEADAERLNEFLPSSLVAEPGGRCMAWLLEATEIAGVGSYREFMFNVVASDGEKAAVTTPFIYVNNDAAMASGREVLGVGKRYANIDKALVQDQVVATVNRSGVDFVTLGMTLDREGTADECAKWASRLEKPSLNNIGGKLISGSMEVKVHRVIHGRGFIDSRPSAADPFGRIRPEATGSAVMLSVDLTLLAPVELED